MIELSQKDKIFIKEVVATGNATQAVKTAKFKVKNDNVAGNKGYRMLRKAKIQKAIKSIADSIPNKLLIEKHLALLNKEDEKGIDVQAVSKGLDMAYKLKDVYEPDNVNNINITQPVVVVYGPNDPLKKQLDKISNESSV